MLVLLPPPENIEWNIEVEVVGVGGELDGGAAATEGVAAEVSSMVLRLSPDALSRLFLPHAYALTLGAPFSEVLFVGWSFTLAEPGVGAAAGVALLAGEANLAMSEKILELPDGVVVSFLAERTAGSGVLGVSVVGAYA